MQVLSDDDNDTELDPARKRLVDSSWEFDPRQAPARPRRRWLSGILVMVALVTSGAAIAGVRVNPFAAAPTGVAGVSQVMGAIPYWDQSDALASLRANPGAVGVASPWSYAADSDGSVILQPHLTAAHERDLTKQLKALGVQVVPTIANTKNGLWDTNVVTGLIADPALRRTHVQAITALVIDNDYDGIQIDYENLGAAQRNDFIQFLTDLAESLHSKDKQLWVTVHPKETDAGYDQRNRAQDYTRIGEIADKVTLMAYDWHWETSPPGPVAPYPWVERVVAFAVTEIPREKLMLGLGLFGYDWGTGTAASLTWGQVGDQARQHPADELWDVASQSPHLTYQLDGVTHQVWYENARSIDLKASLAKKYGLGGLALWRLGREDPSIWRLSN